MRLQVSRIKGLAFVMWQARHMFYHVLIGLVWAWILREIWNELKPWYVFLSVVGSLLPDLDHFWYFLTYGKNTSYTQEIIKMLKDHQWRNMAKYIAHGHKNNTNLSLHNIYVAMVFLGLAVLSFAVDRQSATTLFGAVFGHYAFDIFDDFVTMGQINANWKRWGRGKMG